MGRTEVTVAAYLKCIAAGACDRELEKHDTANHAFNVKNHRLDHPVNAVTWGEAESFCRWMGGRLPTAVEWEYAAKGGEARIFPWGNQPVTGRRANPPSPLATVMLRSTFLARVCWPAERTP